MLACLALLVAVLAGKAATCCLMAALLVVNGCLNGCYKDFQPLGGCQTAVLALFLALFYRFCPFL